VPVLIAAHELAHVQTRDELGEAGEQPPAVPVAHREEAAEPLARERVCERAPRQRRLVEGAAAGEQADVGEGEAGEVEALVGHVVAEEEPVGGVGQRGGEQLLVELEHVGEEGGRALDQADQRRLAVVAHLDECWSLRELISNCCAYAHSPAKIAHS